MSYPEAKRDNLPVIKVQCINTVHDAQSSKG